MLPRRGTGGLPRRVFPATGVPTEEGRCDTQGRRSARTPGRDSGSRPNGGRQMGAQAPGSGVRPVRRAPRIPPWEPPSWVEAGEGPVLRFGPGLLVLRTGPGGDRGLSVRWTTRAPRAFRLQTPGVSATAKPTSSGPLGGLSHVEGDTHEARGFPARRFPAPTSPDRGLPGFPGVSGVCVSGTHGGHMHDQRPDSPRATRDRDEPDLPQTPPPACHAATGTGHLETRGRCHVASASASSTYGGAGGH